MAMQMLEGKPIVNAKKPLALHITERDIKGADNKEPSHCAAARALCREHHAKEVRVHLGRIYVRSNEGNWVRYLTPKALRTEIISFDRGGSFEPGEFRLTPLQPSHRPKGKRFGGNGKPRKTGKKRRPPTLVRNVRGGPAVQS